MTAKTRVSETWNIQRFHHQAVVYTSSPISLNSLLLLDREALQVLYQSIENMKGWRGESANSHESSDEFILNILKKEDQESVEKCLTQILKISSMVSQHISSQLSLAKQSKKELIQEIYKELKIYQTDKSIPKIKDGHFVSLQILRQLSNQNFSQAKKLADRIRDEQYRQISKDLIQQNESIFRKSKHIYDYIFVDTKFFRNQTKQHHAFKKNSNALDEIYCQMKVRNEMIISFTKAFENSQLIKNKQLFSSSFTLQTRFQTYLKICDQIHQEMSHLSFVKSSYQKIREIQYNIDNKIVWKTNKAINFNDQNYKTQLSSFEKTFHQFVIERHNLKAKLRESQEQNTRMKAQLKLQQQPPRQTPISSTSQIIDSGLALNPEYLLKQFQGLKISQQNWIHLKNQAIKKLNEIQIKDIDQNARIEFFQRQQKIKQGAEDQQMSSIKAEMNHLKQQNEGLLKQLQKEREQKAKLQESFNQLQTDIQRLHNPKCAEKDKLQHESNQLKRKAEELQQKLDAYQQKSKEHLQQQSLKDKIFQQQSNRLKQKQNEFQLQSKKIEACNLQLNKVAVENQLLKQQIKRFNNSVHKANQATDSWKTQFQLLTTSQQQKQFQQTRSQQLSQKNRDFQQLMQRCQDMEKLKIKAELQCNSILTRLNQDKSEYHKHLLQLNQKINLLLQQRRQLEEESHTSKKSLEKFQAQFKQITIKHSNIQQEKVEIQQKLKAVQTKLEEQTNDYDKQKRALLDQIQASKIAEQKNKRLNQEFTQKISQIEQEKRIIENTAVNQQSKKKNTQYQREVLTSSPFIDHHIQPYKQAFNQNPTLPFDALSLSCLDRFFQGSLLEGELNIKSRLLAHLEQFTGKTVARTPLLYAFDPLNSASFHNYIDNRRHLLCIVKTVKGAVVAAYYSGVYVDKIMMSEPSLLVSLQENEAFQLKVPTAMTKVNYKGMVYDKYFVIFGNSELRLKISDREAYSNFGVNNEYFDSRGFNVGCILGEGQNRTTKFDSFEFYQLVFIEVDDYREK